jgi:hypothetical protein
MEDKKERVQYHIRNGFMANQFGDKPVFAIGLSCQALNSGKEYEITIGKNEDTKYLITLEEMQGIREKYGTLNTVRRIKGVDLYIIPVYEMRRINSYDKLFDF